MLTSRDTAPPPPPLPRQTRARAMAAARRADAINALVRAEAAAGALRAELAAADAEIVALHRKLRMEVQAAWSDLDESSESRPPFCASVQVGTLTFPTCPRQGGRRSGAEQWTAGGGGSRPGQPATAGPAVQGAAAASGAACGRRCCPRAEGRRCAGKRRVGGRSGRGGRGGSNRGRRAWRGRHASRKPRCVRGS